MAPQAAALRSAVRSAARRFSGQSTRAFSTSHNIEHEKKHMTTWYQISLVATPLALGYAVYCVSQTHEHGDEKPAYPYLRIRSKDFPWGPESLFDTMMGKKEH